MSLPARTGTGLGLTITQALFLALASLVSFFIGMDYLVNDSVSLSFGVVGCCLLLGFLGLLLMVGSTVLNIINAVSVTKRSESKMCRRSLYVFILYPILLISFVLPAFEEAFYTALIFGFPVFIAGTVLLPLFSFFLLKESLKISKKDYVISTCVYCKFPFRRVSTSLDAVCPRCGAYNQFPPDGSDRLEPTTEEFLKPSGEMDRGGYGMNWDEETHEQESWDQSGNLR